MSIISNQTLEIPENILWWKPARAGQQTQRFDTNGAVAVSHSTTSDLGHTWDSQAPTSLSAGWDTSYYTIMFDDIVQRQFR